MNYATAPSSGVSSDNHTYFKAVFTSLVSVLVFYGVVVFIGFVVMLGFDCSICLSM